MALLFGTLRALSLWRGNTRVDVVNVVVLGTLVEGRAQDLARVLESAGAGYYLAVARAIAQAAERLEPESDAEARQRLEHEARRALSVMHQRLSRFAWLDAFALIAIGYAGITALLGERPTLLTTLGLFAATLLWLANVRGSRSIASQAHAGAMALVDSLLASLPQIREAGRT